MKKKERDKEIKRLKKELGEVMENWKRALADYQNLVKRTEKEREALYHNLKKELILKFLPILDLLESGLKQTKDEGLELMAKEFRKILDNERVEVIKAEEKKFDPETMDCVEVVEGGGEGKVAEVVLPGYRLGNEVIRQAKVKVFKNRD